MTSSNQETNPAQEDASKQFAPPRSGRWLEATLQYRNAIIIFLVLVWVFGQNAWAAEFTKASDCVVGKRVLNRDNQAGVIIKAEGSSCQVKLDATGKTDYNIFWMLRPEAAKGKTAATKPSADKSTNQPATLAGELAKGKYACYMLAGGTLNYAFIDIHIDSASRYRDKSGKSGTYSIDATQKIVFTGPLASANAKLLPGQRIGLNMNGGNFFNTSCSMKR
jgi:hypothetical protein